MKKFSFPYEIIYSSRKTLSIQITPNGQVKVRAPKHTPVSAIERLLTEKEDWILKHTQSASRLPLPQHSPLPTAKRDHYRKIARAVFTQKVSYYAAIMNVTYNRISIREQKTRWGSCSSLGNLNFNWRLIFAPEEVVDYVVVHELAHRIEMNHSKAFYHIVASVLPDYKRSQKWLRDNGQSLWSVI